jgi:Zn-dependent peptidase ImmA (M78 family)
MTASGVSREVAYRRTLRIGMAERAVAAALMRAQRRSGRRSAKSLRIAVAATAPWPAA